MLKYSLHFAIFNFSEKLQNIFEIRLKIYIYGVIVQNHSWENKIFQCLHDCQISPITWMQDTSNGIEARE